MTEMTLTWPRHQDAALKEEVPTRSGSVKTVLSETGPVAWIENAGKAELYDCLKVPGLYRRLASCPETVNGVLGFVRTFGLLRKGRRERMEDIWHEIRAIRSVVRASDHKDWAALDKWLHENQQSRAVSLSATLHYERGHNGPTLLFQPQDLISAGYLQLYQDVAKGAQMKQCVRPGCGEWFYYGAGTDHRETARYCSPKCQKAHAYSRTKETVR
jgi:hypothetical protein